MTKHTRFFVADRQPAAVLKHGILQRYLAAFAGRVGSRSTGNRVGYVDGFAGSGIYTNSISGRMSPGSPAIALSIAAALRSRHRSLECTFIEKGRKQYSSLRQVVESANDPHARSIKGDVHSQIGEALIRFSDAPLLVFLDPFGTSLAAQSIVDILLRPSQSATEVLLNFSIDSVRRIGGRIYEPEGAKGRAASLLRMDRWLGGDWWRSHFLAPGLRSNPDQVSLAADSVFAEYTRRINVGAGSRSFAVPIRKQFHHKPIFYLTLFHPNAFALMAFNEAVSLAGEEWRFHLQELDLTEADLHEWRQPTLTGLSAVADLQDVFADDEKAFEVGAIDAIADSIRGNLAVREFLSVRDDFELIFGRAQGAGRQTHLRAAWKQLANAGICAHPPVGSLEFVRIARPH